MPFTSQIRKFSCPYTTKYMEYMYSVDIRMYKYMFTCSVKYSQLVMGGRVGSDPAILLV